MDSTNPTDTHGLHCTRCGVEDDSIVLDPEGGPDLCAVCASDADERENEDRSAHASDEAGGPTLPDGPAAGRAALVSGLGPDCDDYPGEEDDSAVWRCASCGCPCGEHSCCARDADADYGLGGAALGADAHRLPTCPFCDGAPIEERVLRGGHEDGEPDAWAYFVVCRSCAAEGPWTKSAGSARRMWSMRAGAALDDARALLRELAEREPCPECGFDATFAAYLGVDADHAADCQLATWLRLYGSAP